MYYLHVKEKLEEAKTIIRKKMENPNLTDEERETLQHAIDNYDYIIELTDMNHFGRGLIH